MFPLYGGIIVNAPAESDFTYILKRYIEREMWPFLPKAFSIELERGAHFDYDVLIIRLDNLLDDTICAIPDYGFIDDPESMGHDLGQQVVRYLRQNVFNQPIPSNIILAEN